MIETMTGLDWLLIIAAAAVIVITFKKIKGAPKPSPIAGIIMAVILAGAALYGTSNIIGAFSGDETPPPGQTIDTSGCTEFTITPSVSAGLGTLNTDKDTVTIPFYVNQTAHGIYEGDNTTWVDTAVQFVIKPEAPDNFDADEGITIQYEVTNPDQTVDSSSGTYYMVSKSGGYWQCIWTGDGTEYESGSSNMLYTENETITLTIDSDQTGMSYTQSEYDPQRLIVKFYNNCGYSETFYLEFLATNIWTGDHT